MASEKRLIDANALKEYLNSIEASGGHKYYRQGMDDTLHHHMPNIIDDQPTVDAVEVVRCKDCRMLSPDEIRKAYNAGNFCMRTGLVVHDEDFCSYGERKYNG